MKSKLALAALMVVVLVLARLALAWPQNALGKAVKSPEMQAMPGMIVQQDSPAGAPGEQEMNAATQLMSSHHMDMGPHMKMTALRESKAGEQERQSGW